MHALDLSFDSDSDDENIQFLVCVALHEYCNTYLHPSPCRTSILLGHNYVLEILNGHETRSKENFRMEPDVFISLCEALKVYGKLEHSRYLCPRASLYIYADNWSQQTKSCCPRAIPTFWPDHLQILQPRLEGSV